MRAPVHLLGLLGVLLFLNGWSLGCGGEGSANGPGGGTASSGGVGGSSNSTASTTSTSASPGPTSSGASGGDGGCTPGSERACYSGPAGTENVGICKSGTQACNEQGTAHGPCTGEVLPQTEACATPEDESCDGSPACTGSHLWSKRFGDGSHQVGLSVATDADGNVVVTGHFAGTVNIGGSDLTSAGGYDIFVAKFDAAGSHLWSKRFGDGSEQFGSSVATDADGNVVLTGHLAGTMNFGGSDLTSAGGHDIFVAKLDAAGNHLWSKRFGDGSEQLGSSVATDADGNVVVTGGFSGTVSFGGSSLTSAGDRDVFVAKFDAAGDHLWSKRFGDENLQGALSVATDAGGNVLVTGYFEGTVDFGGTLLTSAGSRDMFVVKLGP